MIFLTLIAADKGLTVANIKQTWKNFPDEVKEDPFKAEKNPVAKWFFERYGLFKGTLLMALLSLITLFVALWVGKLFFKTAIVLYILIMLYGIVIINNLYFLLKFSKIIT